MSKKPVFEMSFSSIQKKTDEEKVKLFKELESTFVLYIPDPKSRKVNEFGYITIKAYAEKPEEVDPSIRGGRAIAAMKKMPQCIALDWKVGTSPIDPKTQQTKLLFARDCLGYNAGDIRDQITEEDAAGIKVCVIGRLQKNPSKRSDGEEVIYYNMKVAKIMPLYDEEAAETPYHLDVTRSVTKDVYKLMSTAWAKSIGEKNATSTPSAAEAEELNNSVFQY